MYFSLFLMHNLRVVIFYSRHLPISKISSCRISEPPSEKRISISLRRLDTLFIYAFLCRVCNEAKHSLSPASEIILDYRYVSLHREYLFMRFSISRHYIALTLDAYASLSLAHIFISYFIMTMMRHRCRCHTLIRLEFRMGLVYRFITTHWLGGCTICRADVKAHAHSIRFASYSYFRICIGRRYISPSLAFKHSRFQNYWRLIIFSLHFYRTTVISYDAKCHDALMPPDYNIVLTSTRVSSHCTYTDKIITAYSLSKDASHLLQLLYQLTR